MTTTESHAISEVFWTIQEGSPLPTEMSLHENVEAFFPILAPVLPTTDLWRLVRDQDSEESLALIPWIRGQTLNNIMHLDIWNYAADSVTWDISTHAFVAWIRVWLQLEPGFAAARTAELSEEICTLTLSKFFRIIPEGITPLSDAERDEAYWVSPDKRFTLFLNPEHEGDADVLARYLEELYAADVRLASSMLAHSAMLIRNESLEEAQRQREIALAEWGFVSAVELSDLLKKRTVVKASVRHTVENSCFVPQDVDKEFLQLLKSLSPDEGLAFLRLYADDKTLWGFVSDDPRDVELFLHQRTPLEQFYEDDEFVESAVVFLETLSIQLLQLWQQAAAKQRQILVLAGEKTLDIDRVLAFSGAQWSPPQQYAVQRELAFLANALTEALAGSATRATHHKGMHRQGALVVRGCLNIGLQEVSRHPEHYGVEKETPDELFAKYSTSFFFQVGWQQCLRLREKVKSHFIAQRPEHQWAFVYKAVCGLRVPVYALVLDADAHQAQSGSFTTHVRPFETLEDIEKICHLL